MKYLIFMYVLSAAAVSATPLLRTRTKNHRSLALVSDSEFAILGIKKPAVDKCWGDEIIDDTGDKRAAVICDFITPKGYKSTADIRTGSCDDITGSSCRNKDERGICQGPFTTDGSIRIIHFPEVTQSDKDKGSLTQAYCARVDVYADVKRRWRDSQGRWFRYRDRRKRQRPVGFSEVSVTITITCGNGSIGIGGIIGIFIAALVVMILILIFIFILCYGCLGRNKISPTQPSQNHSAVIKQSLEFTHKCLGMLLQEESASGDRQKTKTSTSDGDGESKNKKATDNASNTS